MRDSVRRASALLAIAGLSVFGALQGCGGGGDSGGNTVPVTPDPTPNPAPTSDFLSVGLSSNDPYPGRFVVVVDPANPAPTRLTQGLSGSEGYNFPAIPSYLGTFDQAAGTFTVQSASMAYFASGGQVYQVSLRKSDKTEPQRISSLTTACAVMSVSPLKYASPEDAWVEVTDAGLDGSCSQSIDNRTYFVRTGAATTAAPTTLPGGAKLMAPLIDGSSGNVVSFLATDTSTSTPQLQLLGSDLSLKRVLWSGYSGATAVLGMVPGANNAAYVRIGSSLVRINWTSTTAVIAGSYYTYADSGLYQTGFNALSDGSAFYFVDGLTVRRLVPGQPVELLGTLDSAGGTLTGLQALSTDHVLLTQGSRGSSGLTESLLSLPKSGGSFVTLATSISAPYPDNRVVLGTSGDDVVYKDNALRRAHADGTGKRIITTSVGNIPILVFNKTLRLGNAATTDSIVWRAPGTQSGNTASVPLLSYNVASDATIVLGTFTHTTNANWFLFAYGDNFTDMPLVLRTTVRDGTLPVIDAPVSEEMFIAQAGKANSLIKVSE